MSTPVGWCEISFSENQRERFGALSEALKQAGVDNQVEFIQATPENYAQVVSDAKKKFRQIRLSGEIGEAVFRDSESHPADLLTTRYADALVSGNSSRTGATLWWPRCFQTEGITRALAANLKEVDLENGVFILGATAEARAVVAALVKTGFQKFNIADIDDIRSQQLVNDFRKAYFQVQFTGVPRHMITQLPNVHSFAVNTLNLSLDQGMASELTFFNFLKAGGVWLDLSLVPYNSQLKVEAESIGAVILSPIEIAVETDSLWVEAAFQAKIDFGLYRKNLRTACTHD